MELDFNNTTVGAVVGGMLTLAGSLVTYFFAERANKKKMRELAIKGLISAVNLYHAWGIKQAQFDALVRFHMSKQRLLELMAGYESGHRGEELALRASAEGEQANMTVGSSREYARLCDEMRAKVEEQLFVLKRLGGNNLDDVIEKNMSVSIKIDMSKRGVDLEEVDNLYEQACADIISAKSKFKALRKRLEEELRRI